MEEEGASGSSLGRKQVVTVIRWRVEVYAGGKGGKKGVRVVVQSVPLENLEVSERMGVISLLYLFHNSQRCSFLSRHFSPSVFHLSFAHCPPAGEPGSAPPDRRASAIREKTPFIDFRGPPIMGLAVPPMERLTLGAGHRQARNGRGLASQGLSSFLDLEGAARPTRTTCHFLRPVMGQHEKTHKGSGNGWWAR